MVLFSLWLHDSIMQFYKHVMMEQTFKNQYQETGKNHKHFFTRKQNSDNFFTRKCNWNIVWGCGFLTLLINGGWSFVANATTVKECVGKRTKH